MTGGANPSGAERTFAPTTGSRLRDYQPLLPAEKFVVTHLLSGEFDRLGDGSLPVADDAGGLSAQFFSASCFSEATRAAGPTRRA